MAEKPNPLELTTLNKSYGEVVALQSLSLTVEPGVTAILGSNGAGKTTLFKCALGLEQPTSGTVRVFGAAPDRRATREHIGVMLQDTELPDLLTGRELLELFASYYTNPLGHSAVIDLAQIESFVDKRYRRLSGGQKRRIQFALAIIGNPGLVFLDEPTTGLDTDARKVLWQVVREFAQEGRSIVLSTHYLEEAEALADRVVILANGSIIADGSVETLRRSESDALIRCETQLGLAEVRALPHCTTASLAGRITEIHTSCAPKTLRILLQRDVDLHSLTVTNPRLEDIFER